MAVHTLLRIQNIPTPLDNVWSFFANPDKLPQITPPYMQFTILSPSQGDRIYAGQLIEYSLKPFPFWKTRWLTEITAVDPGHYFIDEQRRGPYSLWHHQHHFKTIQGGVEMTDLVHYTMPFGVIGNLANEMFVRRQLDGIFRYRIQVVEKMFGVFPASH